MSTEGRAAAVAAVGMELVRMRRKRGITQVALSEATDIAQADISRLENGSGNPTVYTLQRLAQGMGCRLKIAFEWDDSGTPNDTDDTGGPPNDEWDDMDDDWDDAVSESFDREFWGD